MLYAHDNYQAVGARLSFLSFASAGRLTCWCVLIYCERFFLSSSEQARGPLLFRVGLIAVRSEGNLSVCTLV
jgi:hypothetical protein